MKTHFFSDEIGTNIGRKAVRAGAAVPKLCSRGLIPILKQKDISEVSFDTNSLTKFGQKAGKSEKRAFLLPSTKKIRNAVLATARQIFRAEKNLPNSFLGFTLHDYMITF